MLAAADKINSDKLFGDILINFTNAKASAEAALESDDIYQLESACKELNDAILEAQNMAEQFVVLKEQLDIAATYAETTYAGKEAFDAAVAKAQDIYDNLSADPQEAAAALAAAIKAYRLTQVGSADEPADYTFMIVNNGFETGDLTGWTTSSEGDTGVKSNTTAPYTCEGGDGSYLFNTWNNGVGYEISQEI